MRQLLMSTLVAAFVAAAMPCLAQNNSTDLRRYKAAPAASAPTHGDSGKSRSDAAVGAVVGAAIGAAAVGIANSSTIKQLRADNDKQAAAIKDLQAENARQRERNDDLAREKQRLADQVAQLEKQLEKQQETHNRDMNDLSGRLRQTEAHAANARQLQRQLDDANGRLNDADRHIGELTAAQTDLQERLAITRRDRWLWAAAVAALALVGGALATRMLWPRHIARPVSLSVSLGDWSFDCARMQAASRLQWRAVLLPIRAEVRSAGRLVA